MYILRKGRLLPSSNRSASERRRLAFYTSNMGLRTSSSRASSPNEAFAASSRNLLPSRYRSFPLLSISLQTPIREYVSSVLSSISLMQKVR